eukprot:4900527-Pyramimonas_sp.AAC.1
MDARQFQPSATHRPARLSRRPSSSYRKPYAVAMFLNGVLQLALQARAAAAKCPAPALKSDSCPMGRIGSPLARWHRSTSNFF